MRRSVRKQTKQDEAISNADLPAADPPTDATKTDSNIVLTSGETFVINKILGCRCLKRKNMSKNARICKLKKVPVPDEQEALVADLLEHTEDIFASGGTPNAGPASRRRTAVRRSMYNVLKNKQKVKLKIPIPFFSESDELNNLRYVFCAQLQAK